MTQNSVRTALAASLQDYFDSLVSEEFVSAMSFAQEFEQEKRSEWFARNIMKYLVFYWDINDIFDAIKMISHFKGKNAMSGQLKISRDQYTMPSARLDDVSITDDEDVILDRLLQKATSKIYGLVAPYGKNIIGGYLYDQGTLPIAYNPVTVYNESDVFYVGSQLYYTLFDDTPAGTDPTDTDWFRPVGEEFNTYHKIVFTLLYNKNMDPSMITALSDHLEDCLVKQVILNWYLLIQEPQMAKLAQAEYDEVKSEVVRALWYRVRPTRRRTSLL
jgi:hypothetical protein